MHILHHANIITQDRLQPKASAIAIDQNKIHAIGSNEEILALSKSGDKIEDLDGRTIWPGLTDSHLHMQHLATNLQSILCEELSKDECLKQVKEKASSVTSGKWILGHGWDHNQWPNGYGKATELDAVAEGHPVFLTSKSLHTAWVNSKALEIAGIDAQTNDPEGGIILRNSDGIPSGILVDNAIKMVKFLIPNPSVNELADDFRIIQRNFHKVGITAIHDFDRFLDYQALKILDQGRQLNLRVEMSIALDDLQLYLDEVKEHGLGDANIHIGNLKLFADGALGSRTAAMFDPYEGEKTERGLLIKNQDELVELAKNHALPGLSIHAIGDYANHIVLNAFREIREWEKTNNIPARRHRIEHAQLLHPDDFKRFSELHIIASMQPVHATSDQWMAEEHWGKRCRSAYAWNSLLRSKALLIFGSDAPVESFSPFFGMEAAITRKRWYHPASKSAWIPEERISLKNALDAYTINPAFASGKADFLGKLAPGYLADLIVLANDPFEMQKEGLHTIAPVATMFNGEWIFQESDW